MIPDEPRFAYVRLTRQEQLLLLERFDLPDDIRIQLDASRSEIDVWISDDAADELRDQAGDLFQEVGVGADDRPTPIGRVLDSLIDKFFTG